MNQDEDLFRDPNDGAYVREQLRTGPPLEYVCEKTRRTLESLHAVLRELPGDSVRQSEIFHAFVNALTAHLALNNMLALANEPDARERLLRMSRERFQDWLDRVDRGGSVCG